MINTSYIKTLISLLLLALVVCAIMEPVLRSIDQEDQISVVEQSESEDPSEPDTEEGEVEIDKMICHAEEFTYYNSGIFHSHLPHFLHSVHKAGSIDSPPELV